MRGRARREVGQRCTLHGLPKRTHAVRRHFRRKERAHPDEIGHEARAGRTVGLARRSLLRDGPSRITATRCERKSASSWSCATYTVVMRSCRFSSRRSMRIRSRSFASSSRADSAGARGRGRRRGVAAGPPRAAAPAGPRARRRPRGRGPPLRPAGSPRLPGAAGRPVGGRRRSNRRSCAARWRRTENHPDPALVRRDEGAVPRHDDAVHGDPSRVDALQAGDERSVVVFPHPEGPSSVWKRPFSMMKVTSRTARTAPRSVTKLLQSPSTASIPLLYSPVVVKPTRRVGTCAG